MLEALDAELAVLRGERGLVLAGDGHEGREIGALARQILGELEADARRSCIRIDAVVEQPEAVILAQALVLLPHLGDLAQIERDAQRVERRTPHRAIGVGAREHHQALGLLGGSSGALIGDIGGGRRALEQQAFLAIVARPDLQHRPGQTQPVRAVIGRDRHDLPEDLHAAAEVVALEGGVGLAPQRGGRLARLAGVGLDLGFELDRRIGEVIALEGLVGGDGGNGQQQDERSCKGSANERRHGGPPVPAGRGNPSGASSR